MESLYQKFPDVDFKIVLYNFHTMRHSLLDGETDIWLAIASDWQNWTHIRAGTLKHFPFNLILSKKHPLAKLNEIPLQELKEFDCICLAILMWYVPLPQLGMGKFLANHELKPVTFLLRWRT